MTAKTRESVVTPKLRFPEFRASEKWTTLPLNSIAERVTTRNSAGLVTRVLTNSAEHGVVDQREYFDREIATAGNLNGYLVVGLGDYVYNPRTSAIAPVGPISRNEVGQGVMSPLYTAFRFFDENTDFFKHYFRSAGWHAYMRSVAGTGARHDRMSISTEAFMRMPIPGPSHHERKKIADCLTSLDELIASQGRKLVALKLHKRGLAERLFPRDGECAPRLRFPEFRNAASWRATQLSAVLSERKLKSDGASRVHSVSVRRGLVDQVEHLGRSFAAADTSHYNLVKPFDVVYTKSPTGDFPYGIVKQSRLAHSAIVSPLYGVFAPVNKYAARIIEAYFDSPQRAAGYLAPVVKKGAKNTIQVSNATFLLGRVPLPVDPDEQRRVCELVDSIDLQIATASEQLDVLRTHKRGFMRQIFPAPEVG